MAPLKKTTSNASAVRPPLAGSGPGGPIEIVFSFDTTGSMNRCLKEVRQKVGEVIQRLFADIPNLRIAVFAHGDYGDTYVTKHVDFTNDQKQLCDFVKTVGPTAGGGDGPECYELVLKQTRELLSWSPGTQRAMVMIGDAVPHAVGERRNINNIDWEEETEKLRDQLGVRIYSVQAFENPRAKIFWESLAKMTFGKHLNLGQFETIVDMMMSICYREHGPEHFEAYEREVRAREGPNVRKELNVMFDALRGDPSTSSSTATAGTATAGTATAGTAAVITPGAQPRKTVPGTRKKTATPPKAIAHGRIAKASKRRPRVANKVVKKACKAVAESVCKDDNIKYSIGRRYRETVGDRNFAANTLQWTTWQKAILPPNHATDKSAWLSRRFGSYSVRKFKTKMMKDVRDPAMYELAVQPGDGAKLYPVYSRATRSARRRGEHWSTQVLRNYNVRKQIKNVLDSDGSVFIRKVKVNKPVNCDDQIVNSVAELQKLMTKTYDYPWNRTSHRPCRDVKRNNMTLSSSAL